MADSLLARVGRVIAGITESVVEGMEHAAPEAVLSRNISELRSERDQVRHEVSKVLAAKIRTDARLKDLGRETLVLDDKIQVAIEQGRDDLAKAGLVRQEEIVVQSESLNVALSEAESNAAEGERALTALDATNGELERELTAFKASQKSVAAFGPQGSAGLSAGERAKAAADRAMHVSSRLTGLPVDSSKSSPDLHDLASIAQDRRIDQKLQELKAGLKRPT